MDAKKYKIIGEGYDKAGRRYFQIEIDGSAPLTFAANTILADPASLFKALANAGVNCFSAASRTEIMNEVQSFNAHKRSFRVATTLGWFGRQFVLPGKVFGSPKKLPIVIVPDHLDPAMTTKYRSRGTLEEWQIQIAAPAYRNSRPMFGIAQFQREGLN